MRLLLTFLMTIGLIGGMWAYVEFKKTAVPERVTSQADFVDQKISLEVLRSAPLFGDAGFGVPSLEIDYRGETIHRREESMEVDAEVTVELAQAEVGMNSATVFANFEDPEAFLSDDVPVGLYSMQVIVRSGERELHRQTFSDREPTLLGGVVSFEVTPVRTLGGTKPPIDSTTEVSHD